MDITPGLTLDLIDSFASIEFEIFEDGSETMEEMT